jgi:hypothetical protein
MDFVQRALSSDIVAGQLGAASERLAAWLMSTPVLRPAEKGAGVVNWIADDGNWDALYPEICGYYLQFTVQAAPIAGTGDDKPFRSAAKAVAIWLDSVGGLMAEPLTLYHRDLGQSDWRNSCLFAFDLAIILRGLGAVEARWPGLMPSGVFDRYAKSLLRIVANGRLHSHLVRPGASSAGIPVKWSTTQGVLHVKAAAALAGLGRPDMKSIVQATIDDEAALFTREGAGRMRELHPFLYFIEGWLTLWGQTQDQRALAHAGRAFSMVLQQIDPISGEAPPIANMKDVVPRSDVLAQALRAGVVLEAAGQLAGDLGALWQSRRRALQVALLKRISPEGGMIFDTVGQHRNTWASMFAFQALGFVRNAQLGVLDPIAASKVLI